MFLSVLSFLRSPRTECTERFGQLEHVGLAVWYLMTGLAAFW
jgi:hypothetical protein